MPRWHLVGCRFAPAKFWGVCPVPAVCNTPLSTPGRRGPGERAALSSHLVTGQSPQPPDVGTGTIWALYDCTLLTVDLDFKVLWSGNRTKGKDPAREQEAVTTLLPPPPHPIPGDGVVLVGRTTIQETRRMAEPGKPGFRTQVAAHH